MSKPRREHTHRGWSCSVEADQWVTTYRARSPDGAIELEVEYQQSMGDTTIWLRVRPAGGGRASVTLMDPWLAACALSAAGDRLYIDDRRAREVFATVSGEVAPGEWPRRAEDIVELIDLFPSLRQRALGSQPSPFRLGEVPPPEAAKPACDPGARAPAAPPRPDQVERLAALEKQILGFFHAHYPTAEVSRVEVQPGRGIRVETARPGVLIGRRGATVTTIERQLRDLLGIDIALHLVERRRPASPEPGRVAPARLDDEDA